MRLEALPRQRLSAPPEDTGDDLAALAAEESDESQTSSQS